MKRKYKQMKRLTLTILFVTLSSLAVFAQGYGLTRQDITSDTPSIEALSAALPRLIPYYNFRCDANPAQVTFKLYTSETSSNAIWQETQVLTANRQNEYLALLGLTTGGLPASVFSTNNAIWLGAQCAGEPERARLIFTAAPFAMKSVDSDSLGGRPASDYMLAGAVDTLALTSNL